MYSTGSSFQGFRIVGWNFCGAQVDRWISRDILHCQLVAGGDRPYGTNPRTPAEALACSGSLNNETDFSNRTAKLTSCGGSTCKTPPFDISISHRRRYRYYVSQLVIKSLGGERNGPTRVPAHELESRVTEKLIAFLKSDADLFDRLSTGDEADAGCRL